MPYKLSKLFKVKTVPINLINILTLFILMNFHRIREVQEANAPQDDVEVIKKPENFARQGLLSTRRKVLHLSYLLLIIFLMWKAVTMNQETSALKEQLDSMKKTRIENRRMLQVLYQSLLVNKLAINQSRENSQKGLHNQLTKVKYIKEMAIEQHYLQKVEKSKKALGQQNFLIQEQAGRKAFMLNINNFKLVHLNIKLKKEISVMLTEQYDRLRKQHDFSLPELPFCIVVPSYNNGQDFRYQYNLYSIFNQDYTNFKVVIMDDGSPDQNYDLISQWLEEHPYPQIVTMHRNKQRIGTVYNIYKAVTDYCEQDDIVMLVDGDDELLGVSVLKVFNSIYTKKGLDVLYSNLILNDGFRYIQKGWSSAYSEDQKKKNSYRDGTSTKMFPVRSFKASTFRKIRQSDLKDRDGVWFKSASDQVLMPQILELSCGRNDYVDEYFYLKNYGYGNNDMDVDPKLNQKISRQIRNNRAKYACTEND